MTALTVESTNQTLANAGISMRVTQRGLQLVSRMELFAKALAHCTSNSKARDDLITILSHYNDQPELVVAANQSQYQNMHDPVSYKNNKAQASVEHHQAQNSATGQQPQLTENQTEISQTSSPNSPVDQPHTDNSSQEFVGHHVYGKNAAMYFTYDKTRNGDNTIAIDGAMSLGRRQYDWTKKLRIQITRSDLPNVAAVVFGLLKKVELSNYGADNTKRLMIENQGNKYFVNMSAKGYNQIAVPISASDIFEVRGLILAQLIKNRPEIGTEGVLANLKCHAVMIKQANQQ